MTDGILRVDKQRCITASFIESAYLISKLLLHMVYYWTSSELDMAEVHISICELLPECKSVQLHAFYGIGAGEKEEQR